MYLYLDHHSGEPIYRQIVEQIKYKIACGELSEGDRLASIRGLAGELRINPRTVVKAYEELHHDGLVVMKQGQGVFVSPKREVTPVKVRNRKIADLARRMLAEASRMGAKKEDVLAIIREVIEQMETGQ